MSKPSNEYLCALAQKGDTHAADLLLEYNSGFIRKTANEIFLKSNLVESDLSIEIGDLEQEGGIGLLKAIPSYDKSIGVKFLTYAASFIRNVMTDLVRDSFSRYEQRMVDPQNGLGLQEIRLDEILPGEERLLRIEAVADITAKSPEQVYEDRETLRELYEGFGQISEREQTYLLYRYGFTDDIGHTLIGTAIHFNLSESRAKKVGRRGDGQPLAGVAVVVLVRIAAAGRGLLYTSASFSGQSDFASQKSRICAVTHVTKSACPTAAEKHLPPHSALLQSTPPTPFPRQPEAKV